MKLDTGLSIWKNDGKSQEQPQAADEFWRKGWSATRKREVVLRLLRGESLDAVSREIGVEVYRLERWRDKALAAMDAGLKERTDDDPLQAGLDAAHKRIGELSMENELLRAKVGRLENGTPFHRARSRR